MFPKPCETTCRKLYFALGESERGKPGKDWSMDEHPAASITFAHGNIHAGSKVEGMEPAGACKWPSEANWWLAGLSKPRRV